MINDIEQTARHMSEARRAKFLRDRHWYQRSDGHWISPDHDDQVAYPSLAAICKALAADQT